MVITAPLTSVNHLRNLVHNIKVIQPKKILVPEVRRASVAIILRVRLEQDDQPISHKDVKELLFDKKLQKGRVEVFYIQRSIRAGDRWSGQVAFPGGKHEPTDKDDLATAVREVHEEVGIDLNASEYAHIGELDDREVTSRFGTKLLMILSTQVFLQLSTRDNGIQADSSEVAQGIWYDFDKLKKHHSSSKWVPHNISVYQALKPRPPRGKVASAPSFPLVEDLFEFVFGRMKFSSIPLDSVGSSQPVSHPATLWGLTLGITSELWDMAHPPSLVPRVPLYYPLPRYDYPEVNLLIRLFCKPNPDRKPSNSVVNRRTWDRYFLVLKFGFILVLVNRSLVAIWLIRLLYNYYIKNKV